MDTINLSTFSTEEGKVNFQTQIKPLIDKTYEDPALKAEFIANPQKIIERELGISVDLPDNWHFEVKDQTDPFALYINLPVNADEIELTDEELEVVAGGGTNPNCKGGNCVPGCGAL